MKNWIKHFLYTLSPAIKRKGIEVRFDKRIEDFLVKCEGHPLLSRQKVIKWIQQFDDKSYSIPEKVLSNLHYYSTTTLNKLTEELIEDVTRTLNCSKNDIYYVPIGGAGSGSQNIARIIRTKSNVRASNVVNLHELYLIRREEVKDKHILFFDDFSGTGTTLIEWWQLNEPIILPLNANFSIAVMILNHKAVDVVRSLNQQVFHADFLDSQWDVYHNDCPIFNANEKLLLAEYCEKTGCGGKYLKGYGDCGLILSFQHGCPNNSLPILWYNKKQWINLFERRN